MTVNERALYIYSKSREAGLTHAGAIGLIGNFQGETSQLDPSAVEKSYLNKFKLTKEEYVRRAENDEVIYNSKKFKFDSAGFGLAQWTYQSRKQGLLDFAKARKTSIADIDTQLAYAFKEMKERYTQTWKTLTTTNSIYNAVKICVTEFEKPAKQYEAIQTRNGYANNWNKIIPEDYQWKAEEKKEEVTPPVIEEPPVVIIPVEEALTDRKRVIKKALGEVGYMEKRTNEQLDNPTANAGVNNYTKYARDLDAIQGFYNGKKNGYAWCDIFVDWCFVQCFGVEKAIAYLCQKMGGSGAGCTNSMQYFQAKSQFIKKSEGKPQPGDQIFFGTGLNNSYHTGLVYAVDATKVYTVEGNTNNAASIVAEGTSVLKKSYALTHGSIIGYGRPAWNDGYTGNGFEIENEEEEIVEPPKEEEVVVPEKPEVEVTQFDRMKLINIALAEVGYTEKRSEKDLDDREANAGTANFNKYARDLDAIPDYYYHDCKQGLNWCDIFVDWCMMKAYGFENSVKLNGQGKKSYGAGCPQSATYYRNMGRFDMTPQVGDQFWLGWDGANEYHTGIVIGVGSNYVDVVEGNQQIREGVDGVVKKRRMWYEIVGFGHPNYNDDYGTPDYIGNKTEEEEEKPPVVIPPEEEKPPVVTSPVEEEKPPVVEEEFFMPEIKKGDKGYMVKVLQSLLIMNGFSCGSSGIDGDFGNATNTALRDYQSRRKLVVDGICRKATWMKLFKG